MQGGPAPGGGKGNPAGVVLVLVLLVVAGVGGFLLLGSDDDDDGAGDGLALGEPPDAPTLEPMDQGSFPTQPGDGADAAPPPTDVPPPSDSSSSGAAAGTPAPAPTNLGDDCFSSAPRPCDEMARDCHDGDMASCDELYSLTDVGSVAEAYGFTCGGRTTERLARQCESTFG